MFATTTNCGNLQMTFPNGFMVHLAFQAPMISDFVIVTIWKGNNDAMTIERCHVNKFAKILAYVSKMPDWLTYPDLDPKSDYFNS